MSITERINGQLRTLFDPDNDPIYKSFICNKDGSIPSEITKPDEITIGALGSQIEYLRKLSIELIKQLYINTATGKFLKYQLEEFFGNLQEENETDAQWIERTIQIVFRPKVSNAAIIFALRPYSPGGEPEISTIEEKSAYANLSFASVYVEGFGNNPGPEEHTIIVLPAIAESYDSSYYTIQILLYDTNLNKLYSIINLLNKIIAAGITYKLQIYYRVAVPSTYALVYTVGLAYFGGVLANDGSIHFVPFNAEIGQKINSAGTVSTYSLVYTITNAYAGGVLTDDGSIHFVPLNAEVGQKISSAGVVSTYALAYTTANAYRGGVLGPHGDMHFVPYNAEVGQKISSEGVVSTYALAYTTANAYSGGILMNDENIHFVPYSARVGQKISSARIISTYALAYTTTFAYSGGILTSDGSVHFMPYSAHKGQKITSRGTLTTYSLAYTTAGAYSGGVLSLNGDIYFVPFNAVVGQKIDTAGIVSTYALAYTTQFAFSGGVLLSDGTIQFIPFSAAVGQKIEFI